LEEQGGGDLGFRIALSPSPTAYCLLPTAYRALLTGLRGPKVQTFRKIALVVAVLYLGLLGGLLEVMRQPVVFGKVMARAPRPLLVVIPFKQLWFIARAGRLKVGDLAPNFTLPTADKKGQVQLSSFRRLKPVVLIFGSYT
jgi:hypothetical protein